MTDEIPDAPSDTVILNVTPEGVAMVTLNRPEVHNAFNIELVQRLSEIFDDLEDQDGIRIVLIDGAGPSFSAGGDLKEMQRADGQSESEMRGDFADFATMLLRLRGLPQPTVALVHGSAIAGGLGLVAACDIAIATADAAFALSEVRLGIIPAMIAPYVVEAMGPRAARRYMLTGERFGAEEALRLGLVTSVVADRNALAAESERIVSLLLQGGPEALAAAKELLDLVTYMPIDEDLNEETVGMTAERRVSAEGKEGSIAFFEKRKPGWAG
ncbi:MAG: enoyl-CoA hydratase/isomerase family protein [Alphaproteobacteria bacterium]|nr:enoyl-CoA hydratase/isomerase family protein [Alphaproteobacteria bacterium]